MHASLWRFRGKPDELLESYEAMLAEVPVENMRLHLCRLGLDPTTALTPT